VNYLKTWIKGADDVLDYAIRWTRWLDGDTIASAVWTLPAALTEVDAEVVGDVTTVWVSGGVVGTAYAVAVRVTTTGGRTDDRTIRLLVATTTVQEFAKDPDAILDYSLDWTRWLDGDTISTATWTVPSGLTLDSDDLDGAVATAWVSGGTVGESYDVACEVTTAAGRTVARVLRLEVVER